MCEWGSAGQGCRWKPHCYQQQAADMAPDSGAIGTVRAVWYRVLPKAARAPSRLLWETLVGRDWAVAWAIPPSLAGSSALPSPLSSCSEGRCKTLKGTQGVDIGGQSGAAGQAGC